MKINIIVAYDEERAIGKNGTLPWHLPEDMKLFKSHTMGHTVVMGRKTWESIPQKFAPLKGRLNIIISRTMQPPEEENINSDGPVFVSRIDAAITVARTQPSREVFIIGGAQIYQLALDSGWVDTVIASEVHGTHGGDVFFPALSGVWSRTLVSQHDGFDLVHYNRSDYMSLTSTPATTENPFLTFWAQADEPPLRKAA